MKNKLTARNPLIYHAEVPGILINSIDKDKGGKRQRDFAEEKKTKHDSNGGGGSPNKKSKTKVHKKIFMDFNCGIWQHNPSITVTEMCKFCNCPMTQLIKDDTVCFLAFLNRCCNKKCTKKH